MTVNSGNNLTISIQLTLNGLKQKSVNLLDFLAFQKSFHFENTTT